MGLLEEIDEQIEAIQRRRVSIAAYLKDTGNVKAAEKIENIGKKNNAQKFRLGAGCLRELKMAVIMDEFTLASYEPECSLLELTPDEWKEQLEWFQPDLLFIESAWNGKDKKWYRKIDRSSSEIYELTTYCHEKCIPVVFWNKEDPIYTDQFMTTASMADYVFTTDIDCVQRYKTELGHDNVFHLHFAAQPTIHNPIEKYDRKDKFCFAGAYYHRYPKRAEVFDKFSEVFIGTKGLDIYDRNYGNARPEHAFPKSYDKYILGSLPASQIDKAYKGYVYGINMNSVQQSQTMFARRVFEMLASNTITVGNFSRGVKNYFGDLTICTDDKETLQSKLDTYCSDGITADKYRLAGLRKVLRDHLYEDRLDYIVEKVFGVSLKQKSPQITVLAICESEEEKTYAVKSFKRQSYEKKFLYIISDIEESGKQEASDIKYVKQDTAKIKTCGELDADYIAVMSPKDFYGENYLVDLALTLRYGNFSAIGKGNYFYSSSENEITLDSAVKPYTITKELYAVRSIVSIQQVKNTELYECAKTDTKYSLDNMLCVDYFNYCENYKGDECSIVSDLPIFDTGIELQRISQTTERITPRIILDDNIIQMSGRELFNSMNSTKMVQLTQEGSDLNIDSALGEDVHEYLYSSRLCDIKEITADNEIQVKFRMEGSLDCICVCVFYDINGKKLNASFPKPNVSVKLEIPKDAVSIKLGIRPKGKGKAILHSVVLSNQIQDSDSAGCFLSKSNVLVLTNNYPSINNLYRNMFVHKRVTCYKEEGHCLDVMRFNIQASECYREFEGIDIVEGQEESLMSILENSDIDTVAVHFLDAKMWNVLKQYHKKLKIYVWCHGADIEPWWRRTYNYHTEEELERAKQQSAARMELWSEVFEHLEEYKNVHFVFVSQISANEIFEDYHCVLSDDRYTIIHNCIDTDLFFYAEKEDEQRKYLLSIRPYASPIYANDLMVQCIELLAEKEFFNELKFKIIGDGPLFESTLQPLRKFHNVEIEKKFLRQDAIAALHKQFGVFLVPTRGDTQGVSRDEAMSSGLVPVTNKVEAVPEFTDDSCAILAPSEDYEAMALGIERLYKNPQLFKSMSQNAAGRVRKQTSKEFTIDREIELLWGQK